MKRYRKRNTAAFTFMSYATFVVGAFLFGIGLYNESSLELNEKGYYVATALLIAVGAILTQKVVRDNAEDKEIMEEEQRKYDQNI